MNNLKRLRLQQQLKQKPIAKMLGIAVSTYSYWESGKFQPDNEALIKLANFFNVSVDYLLGNTDNPISPDEKPQKLNPNEQRIVNLYQNANEKAQQIAESVLELGQKKEATPKNEHGAVPNCEQRKKCKKTLEILDEACEDDSESVVVPVVGRAAAGEPIEMIEDYSDPIELDDPKIRAGDFAVIASGDSMIDVGIDDGDRVIIRPCPIVDDGVIALVAIENGSTIKRFYKSPDGVQLVPANDNYKIQEYDQYDQVRVLGRFIKVIPSE